MKLVVVHRGARDGYQVAQAIHERGLLERLVTDLYWPSLSPLARAFEQAAGGRARGQLHCRQNQALPDRLVETCAVSGLVSFGLDKIRRTPFRWRARATRWADEALGRRAGEIARERGSALLAYSYYAYSAFQAADRATPRLLFQLHPHPLSMRRILEQELRDHPDCATSLRKEWELALPEEEFDRLCAEPRLAGHWLAASSFTRRTLIENGAPGERVHVAPYGVDLDRFRPGGTRAAVESERPLRVLFVGTINQRKGIKYLLEAVRMLNTPHLQLVIRGRAVDDLRLVHQMVPDADVRVSVSHAELLAAYQSCDLFAFPSIAEGFGHVLLESLASGLPILSTTHTAAPDIIEEGREGFLMEPRHSGQIAERLEWALSHRRRLAAMRAEARRTAEAFTWAKFRARVSAIVGEAVNGPRREAEDLARV